MKVIGVTGNSGSGKTTICEIICEIANAKVIDADEVAKSLDFPGSEYVDKIAELFGQDILENGKLNRKKIGSIIYNDIHSKLELDKITFKYVGAELTKRLEVLKNEELDYIVLDVPLLIESELNLSCDFVISVTASHENKVERIKVRDKISEEVARQRLSIQKDEDFYYRNSDFVIENNGDRSLMKNSMERILESIK